MVVAPDSFKGCLDAVDVAAALSRGFLAAWPEACVVSVPMADGGEGTARTLAEATGGHLRQAEARDPMGQWIKASYGVLGDGRTAVIEVAAASGLTLVDPGQRNPWLTSSAGTGDLIRAALDAGYRRLILGLGGSATNDGGVGMAAALGVRFLDERGEPIPPGGGGLERLAAIDASGIDPRLEEAEVVAACDVDNPLTGPQGASLVFGPQKGATPAMAARLDRAMARFGRILARDVGIEVGSLPGAGAAGGLAAAAVAFLRASLRSGVDLVIETVDLPGKLAGAHLVVTGEGRMDAQTLRGKVPVGVARAARAAGVPAVGVAGSIALEAREDLHRAGFAALLSIADGPMTLEASLQRAESLLEHAGRTIGALTKMFWNREGSDSRGTE